MLTPSPRHINLPTSTTAHRLPPRSWVRPRRVASSTSQAWWDWWATQDRQTTPQQRLVSGCVCVGLARGCLEGVVRARGRVQAGTNSYSRLVMFPASGFLLVVLRSPCCILQVARHMYSQQHQLTFVCPPAPRRVAHRCYWSDQDDSA